METIRLHVVLLTSPTHQQELVSLSQDLSNGDNQVVLSEDMIPHITVYNPEIPSKNLAEAYSMLEKLAQAHESFDIDFDSFDKPPRGDNGIFINYKNEGSIEALFNRVVDAINPLREGVIRAKYRDSLDPNGEIEYYGYPLGYYHFPHVTLARFQKTEDRDKALMSLSSRIQKSFEVYAIAVVKTGEYGTAKRIMQKFNLK